MSALLLAGAASAAPPVAPAVRYVKPSELKPDGHAKGMKARELVTDTLGFKHYVLVFRAGDSVLGGLADFAREHHVVNASFSAIGAVKDTEIGWYDLAKKQYRAMASAEQVEVTTLTGDVSLDPGGQPQIHAHAQLGHEDGSVTGGHLIRATVSPTLELFLTTYPSPLHRLPDEAAGMPLIDVKP